MTEYQRERLRRRYADGLCRSCSEARLPEGVYCERHRDENRANGRRNAERRRQQVVAGYGGRCACCGEDDPRFLSLDHVENDGAAHRAEVGGTDKVYRLAIVEGFPDRFQLLCFNCNLGKARNGGVCPHQEKRLRLAL